MEKLIECLQKLGFKNAAKSLSSDKTAVLHEAEMAVVEVLGTGFKGITPISTNREVSRIYREAEAKALGYVDALIAFNKSNAAMEKATRSLETANKMAESCKELWSDNDCRNLQDTALRDLVLADRARTRDRLAVYSFEDQLHKLAVNFEPYSPGFGFAGDPDQ